MPDAPAACCKWAGAESHREKSGPAAGLLDLNSAATRTPPPLIHWPPAAKFFQPSGLARRKKSPPLVIVFAPPVRMYVWAGRRSTPQDKTRNKRKIKNTGTTGALRPERLAKKERPSMKRLLSIAVFTAAMTAWLAANAGKPTPEAQYSQIKGSFTGSRWEAFLDPPRMVYVKVSVNVQLNSDGSASGTITIDASKCTAVSWSLDAVNSIIWVQTTTPGGSFAFDIDGAGPGCSWPPHQPAVAGALYIERGGYTVK